MRVTAFEASGDIVGHRARIRWEFVPDASEGVANAPRVTLRRKLRDFAFPGVDSAPDSDNSAAYVIYDSKAFPPDPVPGKLSVTDLSSWEERRDGDRIVFEPTSIAVPVNGRPVEILRRTVATRFNDDGVALGLHVEIIDVGSQPGVLAANTAYYYRLGVEPPAGGKEVAVYRGTAMVTDSYGINRKLYEMLPEIYRRHDVVLRQGTAGADSVPEQTRSSAGQLRRFLDPFGVALDSMRGTAEALRTLHDLDGVDAKYLDLLAGWIGWEFGVEDDIALRRNELKNAARFYRLVGTIPGLRALVTQHTGWTTQVAEFAQNIARSNAPPERNLFAVTPYQAGAGWHGIDDAAEILGFPPGNQGANSAQLTGTSAEPFALRPAMELTLSVDQSPPATVRFQAGDFVDIANATALEVAAAINRALPEVDATVVGGKIVLSSADGTSMQVVPAPSSLVALESASGGKISATKDTQARMRLFYESWQAPGAADISASPAAVAGAEVSGNDVLRRLRYKSFAYGVWHDSRPIDAPGLSPRGDPAAVAVGADTTWLAWLDDPQTSTSRLRFITGTTGAASPARVRGQSRGPFALTDGAVVTFAGKSGVGDRFTVNGQNFTDLTHAAADEVVVAMNSQLQHCVAVRELDGSIRVETALAGDQASISVDLRNSTSARALGFDQRNAIGTPGSWDDEIHWLPSARDVVSVRPGRHAELAAVADPGGGIRLAWANYAKGCWRILTAYWRDRIMVGTASGLFTRDGADPNPWTAVTGLASTDVRAVALDANGTAWIATASGVMLRRPNGTVAALAPALPSNDVRDVALDRDGKAWFATAGGIAMVAPNGALTILTTANSLPSNDVRRLYLHDDGALWAATEGGAARLSPDGSIASIAVMAQGSGYVNPTIAVTGWNGSGTGAVATATVSSGQIATVTVTAPGVGYSLPVTVTITDSAGTGASATATIGNVGVIGPGSGLPSPSVRDVAIDADGTLYLATAGGLAVKSAPLFDGGNVQVGIGLPSDDVRAVRFASDGALWLGTAGGVSVRPAGGGALTTLDTAHGLPSNDVLALSFATDGTAWVGTAVGAFTIAADLTIGTVPLSAGAGTPTRCIHTGWSLPQELASGGRSNREPALSVDETKRTWLVWSHQIDTADENWALHCRILDPGTLTWGADIQLTAPPAAARASDRTPSATPRPGGMRVYFASDRSGGSGLWSLDVSLAGAVAPMAPIINSGSSDLAPTPIDVGGTTWLVYRSDASVPLAQIDSSSSGLGSARSIRVPDSGTLRRFAGSNAVVLTHLERLHQRRMFGDLLVYTPNQPSGVGELKDDDLYTRGTIGFYVNFGRTGKVLTVQEAGRLREFLARFVPATLRPLVILVTSDVPEYVYGAGVDIQERYQDVYPFSDVLGLLSDSTKAEIPGLTVLQSNRPDGLSANPADLSTLKRRTFFPPLQ